MKISRVHLDGVKCFKDFTLSMTKPDTDEPLSVCALVGRNGSGKSTILKSIVSLFTVFDERYRGEKFDDKAIIKGRNYLFVDIGLKLNNEENNRLNPQGIDTYLAYMHLHKDYNFADGDDQKDYSIYLESAEKNEHDNTEESLELEAYDTFYDLLKNSVNDGVVIYFDPFRFLSSDVPGGPNLENDIYDPRENSLSSNISVHGKVSGREESIKQWFINLDYMRLKEPSQKNMQIYNHIVSAFELLLHPLVFQGINVEGNVVFNDNQINEEIEIDMLSDGFKSIFLIVSEIIHRLSLIKNPIYEYFYENEAIILIDEIDCHIHPRWQRNLLPSLRKLFPNCQFIVTTHSPFILETLQEYEIVRIGEKGIM